VDLLDVLLLLGLDFSNKKVPTQMWNNGQLGLVRTEFDELLPLRPTDKQQQQTYDQNEAAKAKATERAHGACQAALAVSLIRCAIDCFTSKNT
jgi:hypothetical protein